MLDPYEHVTAPGLGTLFVLLSAPPAHQPKVGRIESMNGFERHLKFEELDKVVVRGTIRDLNSWTEPQRFSVSAKRGLSKNPLFPAGKIIHRDSSHAH